MVVTLGDFWPVTQSGLSRAGGGANGGIVLRENGCAGNLLSAPPKFQPAPYCLLNQYFFPLPLICFPIYSAAA